MNEKSSSDYKPRCDLYSAVLKKILPRTINHLRISAGGRPFICIEIAQSFPPWVSHCALHIAHFTLNIKTFPHSKFSLENKLVDVDIVAVRDLGMSLVAHCPARYHNNKAQQYGNKRKELCSEMRCYWRSRMWSPELVVERQWAGSGLKAAGVTSDFISQHQFTSVDKLQ